MSASYYEEEREHEEHWSDVDHMDRARRKKKVPRTPFLELSSRVLAACEDHEDHRPLAD